MEQELVEREECGTCEFYRNNCCHRFPPNHSRYYNTHALVHEIDRYDWPRVKRHDWCGEYKLAGQVKGDTEGSAP